MQKNALPSVARRAENRSPHLGEAQVMARSVTIFHNRSRAVLLAGLLLALAGCASAPPPTDAMTQAQAMIESARSAQASIYAPLDLGAAEARYAQAQQQLAGKHYDQAARLAGEAAASAELARARAHLGQLKLQVQQQTRDNEQLAGRLLGTAAPALPGSVPAPPPGAGAQLQPLNNDGGGR